MTVYVFKSPGVDGFFPPVIQKAPAGKYFSFYYAKPSGAVCFMAIYQFHGGVVRVFSIPKPGKGNYTNQKATNMFILLFQNQWKE